MTDRKLRELALVSASDKEGIGSICRALQSLGYGLVATGKTRLTLEAEGLEVMDISDLTQEPERFEGRLKTLHHKILGGILYRPDKDAEEWPYDFRIAAVVCNFYPFEEMAPRCDDVDALMEWVDIGGPTMVRAAAKNHEHVLVFTKADQYKRFIATPDESKARLRQRFALEAFDLVARLDEQIVRHFQWKYMNSPSLSPAVTYGENPQQKASFLAHRRAGLKFYGNFSYNNLRDAEGALRFVLPFRGPAVSVVKHQTLCGAAAGVTGADPDKVFEWAWEGDPVSRFGGILALNFEPSKSVTEVLAKKFVEVLVLPRTPANEEWAAELHLAKPRIRIVLVEAGHFGRHPQYEERHDGFLGALVQEPDTISMEETDIDPAKLFFAFGEWAAACSKSNAMVIAGSDEANGLCYFAGAGQGQPNRVEALAKLAIPRAKDFAERRQVSLENLVCFSDAFLPFEDALQELHKGGLRALVQPGGSKRDDEVANEARRLGIRMMIRGQRHFWH